MKLFLEYNCNRKCLSFLAKVLLLNIHCINFSLFLSFRCTMKIMVEALATSLKNTLITSSELAISVATKTSNEYCVKHEWILSLPSLFCCDSL